MRGPEGKSMKTVRLSDYSEYMINDDATPALLRALEECKQHSSAILLLGGGEWHFYREHSLRHTHYISNNDSGEKNIVFPLYGFSNLTIDGEGASLQFHGEVCPFVLDGAQNVTLKNFSIDYPNPYVFQATVIAAEEDALILDVDPESMPVCVARDGLVFQNPDDDREMFVDKLLVCEFDRETRAPSAYIPPYFLYLRKEKVSDFLSSMYLCAEGKNLSDTRIEFRGHFGSLHTIGNKLIGTCGPGPGKRNCPGIFGNRSENILLENITLYATGAMGIICQVCENVTLRQVRTIPNSAHGRYLSVNADATHFVNCLGNIIYEDCVFTGMMDDASNVHGIYYRIHKIENPREMVLTYGHHQQVGINVFDAGDRIGVVNNQSLETVATLTVKSVKQHSPQYLTVCTEEDIPSVDEDSVIEDLTKNPDLYVNRCECGNNRPRGFLPATRGRIVIQNSIFYNMSAGVQFSGDANSWYEAAAVENVLIQGNKFQNAAYAGGVAIRMNPRISQKAHPYHKNITIIDNEFEMSGERFLNAFSVENLIFKNNVFKKNPSLPLHPQSSPNGIRIADCVNVDVEDCKPV